MKDAICLLLITVIFLVRHNLLADMDHDYGLWACMFEAIWMASPAIFIYCLLRLVRIARAVALSFTVLFVLLLFYVADTKLRLTSQAVSFNEIANISHIYIALKYTNAAVLFAVLSGICLLVYYLHKRSLLTSPGRGAWPVVMALLAVSPLAFTEQAKKHFNIEPQSWLIKAEKRYRKQYVANNWNQNIQNNGVLKHLIQTSVPTVPAPAQDNETRKLRKFMQKSESYVHGDIIFILCESCWYDENHFRNAFAEILDMGFHEARALSPAYGGGTANAEFEFLTALPSQSGHIPGVVYQEYADLFNSPATVLDSLPSGYKKAAVHNYKKNFWRRDEVYEQFGFDKFISLSEMPASPADGTFSWPQDKLAFDAALKELYTSSPVFMHLATVELHGPYENHEQYRSKLYTTIGELASFIKMLEHVSPGATVVIYGDHKPSLTKFFVREGIIPASELEVVDDERDLYVLKQRAYHKHINDVPVLIKSGVFNDKKMAKRINGKPFFCAAAALYEEMDIDTYASRYMQANYCDSNADNFQKLVDEVPAWVYRVSLFDGK